MIIAPPLPPDPAVAQPVRQEWKMEGYGNVCSFTGNDGNFWDDQSNSGQ